MSNPLVAPQEKISERLRQVNFEKGVAEVYWSEDELNAFLRNKEEGRKGVEHVLAALRNTDCEVAPAVVIPKEHTLNVHTLAAKPGALGCTARTKCGFFAERKMSTAARRLVNKVYTLVPGSREFDAHPLGKNAIAARMQKKTAYFVPGTNCTLGRFDAYPQRGSEVNIKSVTPGEAADACFRQGFMVESLNMEKRCAIKLNSLPVGDQVLRSDEDDEMRINAKAESGYPVDSRMDKDGVLVMVLRLAHTFRAELERAYNADKKHGIEEWYDAMLRERPAYVLCKGKAKADNYTPEKVLAWKARFYVCMPKHMSLIMQQATQPLEKLRGNLYSGYANTCGVTLTHGGAEVLVDYLDHALESGRGQETFVQGSDPRTKMSNSAYVLQGDDTMLAYRLPTMEVVLFSLDCTSFDLSQHQKVMGAVDDALMEQLASIDGPAARLWRCFMRKRLTNVSGNAVYLMHHGAPSGMHMNSAHQCVVMDVCVNRLLAQITSKAFRERYKTNEEFRTHLPFAIAAVGRDMGLTIRLEDYVYVPRARTVRTVLAATPFLFIGYYFHVRDEKVWCCVDLPRTLSQIRFPHFAHEENTGNFQLLDAVRIGSVALGLGVPPVGWDPAFEDFRRQAEFLLQLQVDTNPRASGQVVNLQWAQVQTPNFVCQQNSVPGLLAAVRRQLLAPRELWQMPADGVHPKLEAALVTMRELNLPTPLYSRSELKGVTGNPVKAAYWARELGNVALEWRTLEYTPNRQLGRLGFRGVWAPNRPPIEEMENRVNGVRGGSFYASRHGNEITYLRSGAGNQLADELAAQHAAGDGDGYCEAPARTEEEELLAYDEDHDVDEEYITVRDLLGHAPRHLEPSEDGQQSDDGSERSDDFSLRCSADYEHQLPCQRLPTALGGTKRELEAWVAAVKFFRQAFANWFDLGYELWEVESEARNIYRTYGIPVPGYEWMEVEDD